MVPNALGSWTRGLMICWSLLSVGWLVGFFILQQLRKVPAPHNAARRHMLTSAGTLLLGAPAAVLGYGMFVQRTKFALREQKIEIPDLPHDLDGLRLVQLTDIHLSPFLTVPELDYAVQLANETKPMVTVVTGDLITVVRDPLHACLDSLQKLRADAGIYGCLGNHEIYAGAEDEAEREGARRGIVFLRKQQAELRFGGATLNLAGVDYQPFREPYLVGAETLLRPGAANLLMSHNPDVFPVATRQGWNAVVSGHMHGGQIRVEILHADMNLARIFTPFVDGLYREANSSIFVSRGKIGRAHV